MNSIHPRPAWDRRPKSTTTALPRRRNLAVILIEVILIDPMLIGASNLK